MKHKHHIIPKHIGGSDDASNIIELTIEEHAQAHRLLWEEYGRWQDFYAWQGLSGQIGKEELIRKIQSVANSKPKSEETKQKMSAWQIGRKLSEEHLNSISKTQKQRWAEGKYDGVKTGPKKGIFKQSQHQKQTVSEKLSKTWSVISPKGDIQIITNLREFCLKNNLDQGNMVKVSKGILKQHKGWKCLKINN